MIIIPENIEIHKPDKILEDIVDKTKIKEKLLYKTCSDFHNIFVVKNSFGTFLKYNDTYQAGYIDTKLYKGNLPYINYFLLPYFLNKNIKKILFIGLGSGIIINQYEKLFNNIKLIDIVDIEENILNIAKEYFNFKQQKHTNMYLQDAIVFLKTTKKKYDLIVVDVAGNNGIDDRFIKEDYISLIKNHLSKNGIFVSNLPSSRDIFNKKNKIFLETMKIYEKYFSDINIFNGETSNKTYYKVFFNINESVYDITNAIIFASDFKQKINYTNEINEKLEFDINCYLNDLITYKQCL